MQNARENVVAKTLSTHTDHAPKWINTKLRTLNYVCDKFLQNVWLMLLQGFCRHAFVWSNDWSLTNAKDAINFDLHTVQQLTDPQDFDVSILLELSLTVDVCTWSLVAGLVAFFFVFFFVSWLLRSNWHPWTKKNETIHKLAYCFDVVRARAPVRWVFVPLFRGGSPAWALRVHLQGLGVQLGWPLLSASGALPPSIAMHAASSLEGKSLNQKTLRTHFLFFVTFPLCAKRPWGNAFWTWHCSVVPATPPAMPQQRPFHVVDAVGRI